MLVLLPTYWLIQELEYGPFEPDPYAFEILSKRFESRPNVTCLNKGVWKENSKTELYFHKDVKGQ